MHPHSEALLGLLAAMELRRHQGARFRQLLNKLTNQPGAPMHVLAALRFTAAQPAAKALVKVRLNTLDNDFHVIASSQLHRPVDQPGAPVHVLAALRFTAAQPAAKALAQDAHRDLKPLCVAFITAEHMAAPSGDGLSRFWLRSSLSRPRSAAELLADWQPAAQRQLDAATAGSRCALLWRALLHWSRSAGTSEAPESAYGRARLHCPWGKVGCLIASLLHTACAQLHWSRSAGASEAPKSAYGRARLHCPWGKVSLGHFCGLTRVHSSMCCTGTGPQAQARLLEMLMGMPGCTVPGASPACSLLQLQTGMQPRASGTTACPGHVHASLHAFDLGRPSQRFVLSKQSRMYQLCTGATAGRNEDCARGNELAGRAND